MGRSFSAILFLPVRLNRCFSFPPRFRNVECFGLVGFVSFVFLCLVSSSVFKRRLVLSSNYSRLLLSGPAFICNVASHYHLFFFPLILVFSQYRFCTRLTTNASRACTQNVIFVLMFPTLLIPTWRRDDLCIYFARSISTSAPI